MSPSYRERLKGPAWRIILPNGRCHASVSRRTIEEARAAFREAGMIPRGEYELRRAR